MYAQRHAPRRVNRGSLGLSVAIVGPLVTAAMLSNPTIRAKIVDKPITAYPVPVEPPPPPEPLPRPAPQPRSGPVEPIDLPTPTVPSEPKTPWSPPPQPPMPDPGPIAEPGGGAVVEPIKPLPPVLTGVEVDPRYTAHFQPLYPPAEQRAGRDGVVTLRVLVGVDGRVQRAEQVMATSEEFWRVTLKQALGRWRFRPATRDGAPYEAWRTMTVRFTLEDR